MSSRLAAGHSHYFRELMRHKCAPGVSLRDAAGAALDTEQLAHTKLTNGGIAKCTLDFGASADAPVTEVQLLFETQLIA